MLELSALEGNNKQPQVAGDIDCSSHGNDCSFHRCLHCQMKIDAFFTVKICVVCRLDQNTFSSIEM